MTDLPPALRVQIKLSNNRLIRARERLGYKSAKEASESTKAACYGVWVAYENFRESPLTSDGDWKPSALAVADALFSDPSDLWPKDALSIRKRLMSIECDAAELTAAIGRTRTPERLLEAAGAVKVVDDLLARLPSSLRDVLTAHAFDGKYLHEIADDLGLSVERTRQLERAAMRRMRNMIERDVINEDLGRIRTQQLHWQSK
jgi:RNA polymerase sigma factor (sigma-70 family)